MNKCFEEADKWSDFLDSEKKDDESNRINVLNQNEVLEKALRTWESISPKIIPGLLKEKIPLSLRYYVDSLPASLGDKIMSSGSIPEGLLDDRTGIILVKQHYQVPEDRSTRTEWLTEKSFSKSHLVDQLYGCMWIFLPLFMKGQSNVKPNIYSYFMRVIKIDFKKNREEKYAAFIETRLDGSLLKPIRLSRDTAKNFPYRIPFPKQIISKINRYLANNFWTLYWTIPSCAAWYRTDKDALSYLDRSWPSSENVDDLAKSLWKECVNLVNGPYGETASVLLAYTCFSILKPFFLTYHELHKDSEYFECKRYIPKQIAVNVESDCGDDAERLVDICCGYFSSPHLDKSAIINGIQIRKSVKKRSKLSVDKFEKALIQPACVLWVNYRPDTELIQSGKILNIRIHPQNEGGHAIAPISTKLVRVLTNGIHKETVELSNGSKLGYCLEKSDKEHKKHNGMPYTLDYKFKGKIALLNYLSKSLRSKYIMAAADVGAASDSKEERDEIMPDLDISIVEKIAYLLASFRVFGEIIFKSEYECAELCDKVELAIIHAFMNQIGPCNPTEILTKYISSLLESGQCARIRGQNSDSDGIRAWYDPKSKRFLLPSKTYFDDLKRTFLTVDVNKREFEAELVRANALCVVQREKQDRRSFEVVVQKGGGKLSVLKINAAFLSGRFSENVRKQLAKMERDQTSYRS